MAFVEIPTTNYKVVAEKLGLQVKEGRKNVSLLGDGIKITGVVENFESKQAKIDWITASEKSGETYQNLTNKILDIIGIPENQRPKQPYETGKQMERQPKVVKAIKDIDLVAIYNEVKSIISNLNFIDHEIGKIHQTQGWIGRQWKIESKFTPLEEVKNRIEKSCLKIKKFVDICIQYDDDNIFQYSVSLRIKPEFVSGKEEIEDIQEKDEIVVA